MQENLEAQIRKLQEYYWSDSDPDGRGFVSLADLYRRTGDLSEARRLLNDGLARHGSMASGHLVLGWVFLDQGNLMEAEASFRAALAVDPGNIAALKGLGNLLLKRDETEEALAVHEALHLLDPLDPELPERLQELQARAEARSLKGPGPAEGMATEAGKGIWKDVETAAESLDWESAALQEDRSTEVDDAPEAGEALLDEAESLRQDPVADLGEDQEVPVSLAGPDEEEPDALVTRTMGEIYLRQGLLQEARRVFEVLLERSPGDEALQERLWEVEEEMGLREPKVPDPVVSIAELAPDVILPVADLAPDDRVAVSDLHPTEVKPVAEPGPDRIVSIADLAPDVIVPISALAPDETPEDPTLDAFEAWLDNLQ